MLKLVMFRVLYAVVVMWAASVFIFGLSRMAGDPRNLYLSEYVTREMWEEWGRVMGLDRPLVGRYNT